MAKRRHETDGISVVQSFEDDYALLDQRDRASVDDLVAQLRRRMTTTFTGRDDGRIVAIDEYRLRRTLDIRSDDILTVTNGVVSIDVLCRVSPMALVLLGAHGRDATDDALSSGLVARAG